jgi:putative ABC transport system permease protein
MLGIAPKLGRGFRADEEPLSAAPVAILSDELWRSRFNADTAILGRQIVLNDQGFTVVGVLSPSAHFLNDPDIVAPLRPGTDDIDPTFNNMTVFAKLRAGLSFTAASAAIASQTKAMNAQFGQNNQVMVVPLEKFIVGDSRPLLFILLGAVAAVLLITCANTANLILARGAARQKEIAIRVALGAKRGRLVRQLLTESFVISFLGASLALGFLWATEQSLTKLLATHLPAGVVVHLDATVLLFTLGLSVLTGIVFGLAPALQASTRNLRQRLSATGRLSSAPASQRMRSALVIAEIAFSLALLAGAGLLLRSFARLMNENKGFDPEHVLTLRVWPSPTRYANPQKDVAYLNAIVEQTQALPGVQAAGWVSNLPMFGNAMSGDIVVDGMDDDDVMMMASKQLVGGDYFHVLRMPLLRGRVFDRRDTPKSPLVAVVDQAFVQRYLSGRDPIGQRLNFGFGGNGWCQIVGVVGSVKEMSLDSEAMPTVYVPLAQRPALLAHMAFSLAVRTSTDPGIMSQSVRDTIHRIDSSQIIEQVRTMDDLIDSSVASRKAPMWLFSSFAAIALFLAAIGVYGLLSYWVTQRQEEIGMRLALGAPRSRVLSLVLGHASKMIGAGLAAGMAISLATARALSGLLYHLKPTDLPTLFGVSLLLGLVALLACAVPVFRATRVDPLTVLRTE